MLRLVTRWLVGLDLQATSVGALRFAAWVHAQGPEAVELDAVHVVEQLDQHYAIQLGLHSRGRVLSLTRQAVHDVLGQHKIERCFCQVDALSGGAADEVLDEELGQRNAVGMIVGRQGPLREGFPPRLGRVARHLLRHAAGPVVVVPPELEIDRLSGPVVLATDLGPSSRTAAAFAKARAVEWNRPLLVVHVVPPLDSGGPHFLPREAQEAARRQRYTVQREALEQWMESESLRDADGLTVEVELPVGKATEELLAIARRGSPLVVCGARRLSWMQRHLRASHAATLAAHAPVPVAVVPPEQTDAE